MTTLERSAQAYERLRLLTDEAGKARIIAFSLTKLLRAIDAVTADSVDYPGIDRDFINLAIAMREATLKRRVHWQREAGKLEVDCESLNERIQNGVYNDPA
jgi:hypothetical protein